MSETTNQIVGLLIIAVGLYPAIVAGQRVTVECSNKWSALGLLLATLALLAWMCSQLFGTSDDNPGRPVALLLALFAGSMTLALISAERESLNEES